jgi:hypothetical protein
MKAMTSARIYSGYNSDSGVTFTHEYGFQPSFTVGQASFNGVSGAGLHHTGVLSFRTPPNDPHDVGNINDFHTWEPFVYADQCIGETFGTTMGAGQEGYVLINLFFW